MNTSNRQRSNDQRSNDQRRNDQRSNDQQSDDQRRISMFLSKVLRHQADRYNLTMSDQGYVLVSDLLALQQMRGVSRQMLIELVENNNKQRFSFDSSGLRIRANQGHSIELDSPVLTPITLATLEQFPQKYRTVCHGTYQKFLEKIQKEGLKKMGRTHVHFAKGLPESDSVISGMRTSCDTVIYLDLRKAIQDGLEFFESSNGVILCQGPVESKYFSKIETRK